MRSGSWRLMGPAGRPCGWLLAAAAVFSVWSCDDGGSAPESPASDRAAVERTVLAYFDALEHADGERACEQLTKAMQARARAKTGAASCPDGLEAVARYVPDAAEVFAGTSVKSVAVERDRARVTVDTEIKDYMSESPAAGQAVLERIDGKWKIAELPTGPSRPNPFAECVGGGLRSFDQGSADPYWREQGREAFVKYLKRVCRRVVKERPNAEVTEEQTERIGAEVLRDMIARGELSPPH